MLDKRYSLNQVNSGWEAAITRTIYDGTNDFVGNVGHALWEYPQEDPNPHQTGVDAWLNYHCGRAGKRPLGPDRSSPGPSISCRGQHCLRGTSGGYETAKPNGSPISPAGGSLTSPLVPER